MRALGGGESLSLRNLEKRVAEQCIEVDDLSVYRWVSTRAPQREAVFRQRRRAAGRRWRVDETDVEIQGRWTYGYRAVKRIIKPRRHFTELRCARLVLSGVSAMRRMRKE